MKAHATVAFGAALLVGAASAFAEGSLYKLRQPDGGVVYSSEKLPGMPIEKELPATVPGSKLPLPLSAEERAADKRVGAELARRDELWRERNQAREALAVARAAKLAGEEPLPGERKGTASHRSRLDEAYWARQDQLQRAVDQAQQRLDRAEKALRDTGS
jgi:hypothetical protein